MKRIIVWFGVIFTIGCANVNPNIPSKTIIVSQNQITTDEPKNNPTPNPIPTNPTTIQSTIHFISRNTGNEVNAVEVDLDGNYVGTFNGSFVHTYDINSSHDFVFYQGQYKIWRGALTFKVGDSSIVIYLERQ